MTLDEREKKLDDAMHRALDNIFKVATGTLAISITFKASIRAAASSYLGLLSTSWISLGITVLCYLVIQLCTAILELEFAHDALETSIKPSGPETQKLSTKITHKKVDLDTLTKAADIFYKVFLLSFVVGISCFIIFAVLNNI